MEYKSKGEGRISLYSKLTFIHSIHGMVMAGQNKEECQSSDKEAATFFKNIQEYTTSALEIKFYKP